jgi:HTH-type transcriptional regulator/antitoxin HigA
VLESQLTEFHAPAFPYAARRREDEARTPLQLAWLHKTYNLARRMDVERFSEGKLEKALDELKALLHAAEEIGHVPEILQRAGVRFLAVEALPSSKIDGVCFWLNANSPAIAVSLRYDRIDHFWFTLLHELHHIKFGHAKKAAILDTNVMEDDGVSKEELLVDWSAANFLVPHDELDSFITRVRPSFGANQIKDFSKRMGVHMGIVVGQLQYRDAIGFRQYRNTLVKVRSILTQTATYDGWGMMA